MHINISMGSGLSISSSTKMTIVSELMALYVLSVFLFPCMARPVSFFAKLPLPQQAIGPESFAFDFPGERLYTGVADGRVLKYQPPFVDFAFDSQNRSETVCKGQTNQTTGPMCGRPLGIAFYRTTLLYIADAYHGLLVVGMNGGRATQLATSAEGVPINFADGLDVDQETGNAYFTDASERYGINEIQEAVANNDSTGRFLKYDPLTKNVTVLLRNLSGPAGCAVSADHTFVLVTEFISGRVLKYWLEGPKANTSEVLVTFPGRPDNIKRIDSLNEFWVAVNYQTQDHRSNLPAAARINAFGELLDSFNVSDQYNTTLISEVQEYRNKYYIGSMYAPFVGVYNRF